jgi:hypothetical protein
VLKVLEESFNGYIMNSTFSSALFVATTATKIDTLTSGSYKTKISKVLGDLFAAKDYEHAIQYLYAAGHYPIGAVLKQASKDIYKQWYICHSNNQQSTAKLLFAYAYSFAPEYNEDNVAFRLAKADYIAPMDWKLADKLYTELCSAFDSEKLGRSFTLLEFPRSANGLEIWKVYFHTEEPISLPVKLGRKYTFTSNARVAGMITTRENARFGEWDSYPLNVAMMNTHDDVFPLKSSKGNILTITWSNQ